MKTRTMRTLALVFVATAAGALPLSGQFQFGPQVSWAEDAELGIGARAAIGVPALLANLEIHASFDYFFVDDFEGFGVEADATYWELNGNAVYKFNLTGVPTVTPYVGAGVNVAHISGDVSGLGGSGDFSDTDLGLNILGGTQFNVGSVTPYVELRIEAGGGEQFVITGGLLIG